MIRTFAAAAFILAAGLGAAQAQSVAVPTNDSIIQQVGDFNTVTVKQVGGGNTQSTLQGAIGMPSFYNFASTTQLANPANGGSNTSTTIQTGLGSNVSSVMQVALAGGTNIQTTIQNGFANTASTTQIAHAGLTNSSTIMQTGSHNTATVTQK